MVEMAEDVVFGLRAILKALNVERGYIGIEDNKPDAIQAIKDAIGSDEHITIYSLHTKYPQGAEKQLIQAITGKEVPSGGLPADVGVVVQNVGTAAAISRFLKTGLPLIERVVTVTGSAVSDPKTWWFVLGFLLLILFSNVGITPKPRVRLLWEAL